MWALLFVAKRECKAALDQPEPECRVETTLQVGYRVLPRSGSSPQRWASCDRGGRAPLRGRAR